MTTIFDGKAYRLQKEKELSLKVIDLFTEYEVVPRLVSIIVGEDPASIMYVGLKQKAAERVGCELLVVSCKKDVEKKELQKTIQQLNNDINVNGIMVQLPLPNQFSDNDRDEILESISLEKDVDGLRVDSKFTPPTAKAVLEILKLAFQPKADRPLDEKDSPYKVAVVGASGFIGQQIVRTLKKELKNKRIKGTENIMEIIELNSKTKNLQPTTYNSDVIISVTGVTDLIKADMVKDGTILIDVGAPNGDIEKSAYDKASFVSPVPGGVGPVTISCLLENLVESATFKKR